MAGFGFGWGGCGAGVHTPDMDMHSRQQYLERLRAEYIGAAKAAKTKLLDEAEKRTALNRKYLITQLRPEQAPRPPAHRQRAPAYGAAVRTALVECWNLFDYACGQRLAPLLRSELGHLRQLGEIHCSDETAAQLQQVSPRPIVRLLSLERRRLHLSRYRNPNLHPLLSQLIPVRLCNEWDRNQIGNLQIDLVLHCGQSAAGHFAYTLSVDDISSGWWAGRAMLGRSQSAAVEAFQFIHSALPFHIREIHPDNDSAFLNDLLYRYCRQHHIAMSRSRPLHCNDNAWVEQRNWTHVRKVVGYRRLDTQQQVDLLNGLYADLMLYKNFFQTTMKLAEKRRVRGKLHRRYQPARSPFQRLLGSGQLTSLQARRLQQLHDSLNPAELQRRIKTKQDELLRTQKKPAPRASPPTKRTAPRLVRSFMTQPSALWLGP